MLETRSASAGGAGPGAVGEGLGSSPFLEKQDQMLRAGAAGAMELKHSKPFEEAARGICALPRTPTAAARVGKYG